MQRSALCRSRRELSNEYLLAKIGVDTDENELLQVLFNIIQYYSIVSLLGVARSTLWDRRVSEISGILSRTPSSRAVPSCQLSSSAQAAAGSPAAADVDSALRGQRAQRRLLREQRVRAGRRQLPDRRRSGSREGSRELWQELS